MSVNVATSQTYINPLTTQINTGTNTGAAPLTPAQQYPEIFSNEGSLFNAALPTIEIKPQASEPNFFTTPKLDVNDFINSDKNLSITSSLPQNCNLISVTKNNAPNEIFQALGMDSKGTYGVEYADANNKSVTAYFTSSEPQILLARQSIVDGKTVLETFDDNGKTIQKTIKSNDVTTTQKYDSTGELTEESSFQNGTTITTQFDNDGNPTSKVATRGSQSIDIDPITNKPTSRTSTTIINGESYTVKDTFSYNEDGSYLVSTEDQLHPNRSQTKTYDAQGILQNIQTSTSNKLKDGTLTTTRITDTQGNITSKEADFTGNDGTTFKIKYDKDGNVLTTPKAGESFAQTASRLGIKQGTSMYEVFAQQNSQAAKDGYFQAGIKDNVKIPNNLIGNINIKELNINASQQNELYAQQVGTISTQKTATIDTTQALSTENNINSTRVNEQADALYNAISGLGTDKTKLSDTLKNIEPNEIFAVLNKYEEKNKNTLLNDINSEWGLDKNTKDSFVDQIINKATKAAQNAGLSEYDIAEYINIKSKANWDAEGAEGLSSKLSALGGAVTAIQSSAQMSDVEAAKAMAQLNNNEVSIANKNFNTAREGDDNFGIAGDTVLGWFGCQTIDDMKKELNIETNLAQTLLDTANSGDIEGFKATYKQIFNTDFNPKAVAAYEEATENYRILSGLNETDKALSSQLREINYYRNYEKSTVPSEALLNNVRETMHLEEAQFTELLNKYGNNFDGLEGMLLDVRDNIEGMRSQLPNMDQINSEIKDLRNNMFGGKDIVKDIDGFNKRQMATQIGANIVVDIAIAAATGPVVGLVGGAVAAGARAVNVGAKAIKLANTASKLAETSKVAKWTLTGSKAIATSFATNGVRSAANGNEMKSADKILETTAEKTALKNTISKFANVSLKVAGKFVNAGYIAANYADDIYEIISSSNTPRADLIAKTGMDANTANKLLAEMKNNLNKG